MSTVILATVNLRTTPEGFDLIVESLKHLKDSNMATAGDKACSPKERQAARAQVTRINDLMRVLGVTHRG